MDIIVGIMTKTSTQQYPPWRSACTLFLLSSFPLLFFNIVFPLSTSFIQESFPPFLVRASANISWVSTQSTVLTSLRSIIFLISAMEFLSIFFFTLSCVIEVFPKTFIVSYSFNLNLSRVFQIHKTIKNLSHHPCIMYGFIQTIF